jgi:hypothetical protein
MIIKVSERNAQTLENGQMKTRLIEINDWDLILYKLSAMDLADNIPINPIAQQKNAIIDELIDTLESLGCDFSYATDLLFKFEQNRLIIENLHPEDGDDQDQIPTLEQQGPQTEVAVDALVFINNPHLQTIAFEFLGQTFTLALPCFFSYKTSLFYSNAEFSLNKNIIFEMFWRSQIKFELKTRLGKHGGHNFPLNFIRNIFTKTHCKTVNKDNVQAITMSGEILLNPIFNVTDHLSDTEEPRQAPLAPILAPAPLPLAPRPHTPNPPSRFTRFARYLRSLFRSSPALPLVSFFLLYVFVFGVYRRMQGGRIPNPLHRLH